MHFGEKTEQVDIYMVSQVVMLPKQFSLPPKMNFIDELYTHQSAFVDPAHNLLEPNISICLAAADFTTFSVHIFPKRERGKSYYHHFHSWATEAYNTARKQCSRRKSILQKDMNQLQLSYTSQKQHTWRAHQLALLRGRDPQLYVDTTTLL